MSNVNTYSITSPFSNRSTIIQSFIHDVSQDNVVEAIQLLILVIIQKFKSLIGIADEVNRAGSTSGEPCSLPTIVLCDIEPIIFKNNGPAIESEVIQQIST
jgi:hypothetical protein